MEEREDEKLVHFCLLHNVKLSDKQESKEHAKIFDCSPVRVAMKDLEWVQQEMKALRSTKK